VLQDVEYNNWKCLCGYGKAFQRCQRIEVVNSQNKKVISGHNQNGVDANDERAFEFTHTPLNNKKQEVFYEQPSMAV